MKLKYISKDYKPKGDLEGFPLEVIDRMLQEQFEQTGKVDVTIFERNRLSNKYSGGFNWGIPNGYNFFWPEVVRQRNFKPFFERYPERLEEKEQQKNTWIKSKEEQEKESIEAFDIESKRFHDNVKRVFKNTEYHIQVHSPSAKHEYKNGDAVEFFDGDKWLPAFYVGLDPEGEHVIDDGYIDYIFDSHLRPKQPTDEEVLNKTIDSKLESFRSQPWVSDEKYFKIRKEAREAIKELFKNK